MSDWNDKLAAPVRSHEGRAQASRKKLLERRGAQLLDATTVVIDTMGGREVWRRVTGDEFVQEVRS